jgi:folate-binding protein YgfZ
MTDHPMNEAHAFCRLDDFAVLRFRGADAVRFLQGQLSGDVSALQPGGLLRAGVHNPQGRALALFWLVADGDDILGLLPRELADGVAGLLRRYVLRAKLTIADESEQHRVLGLYQHGLSGLPPGFHRLDADRAVQVLPRVLPATAPSPDGIELTREQWRGLDIAAGAPQIYQATTGQFVAQMLNLDCVDAISFTKGCYTGQEVIARAHYRGRVKRRMQRFETLAPTRLAPGDRRHLDDGRDCQLVEAVTRSDGRCEFLAVAALATDAPAPTAAASAVDALRVSSLPLPYALPE